MFLDIRYFISTLCNDCYECCTRENSLVSEIKESPIILGDNVTVDPIYPTPPLGQDMTQGQFFKRSLAGLNLEFSFY